MELEIEHDINLYKVINFIKENIFDTQDISLIPEEGEIKYFSSLINYLIKFFIIKGDKEDLYNVLLEELYIINNEKIIRSITDLMMKTRFFINILIEEYSLYSEDISWDIIVINSRSSILILDLVND